MDSPAESFPTSDVEDAASAPAVSARRRAANRANAKRSTGPRTAQGKSRARLNAVRHGLRAELPVERTPDLALVLDEDPRAYEDLRDALYVDLRPAGAAEQLLTERLARAAWRMRRAEAVEVELLDEAELDRISGVIGAAAGRQLNPRVPPPSDVDRDPMPLSVATARQFEADGDPAFLRLAQYQARIEGSFRACLRELRQLRKDRANWDETPDERLAPPPPRRAVPRPPGRIRLGKWDMPVAPAPNEPTAPEAPTTAEAPGAAGGAGAITSPPLAASQNEGLETPTGDPVRVDGDVAAAVPVSAIPGAVGDTRPAPRGEAGNVDVAGVAGDPTVVGGGTGGSAKPQAAGTNEPTNSAPVAAVEAASEPPVRALVDPPTGKSAKHDVNARGRLFPSPPTSPSSSPTFDSADSPWKRALRGGAPRWDDWADDPPRRSRRK